MHVCYVNPIDIYIDEIHNNKGTTHNNPFKIRFDSHYSTDEIKKAINKLLNIFPVLSARIMDSEYKNNAENSMN